MNGYDLVDSPNADLVLALAGLRDVVGSLHAHERVHLYAEGLFETQGHIAGQIGFAVE